MSIFWLESLRLAMQTTELACRQCQLMALMRWIPVPRQSESHDD